MRNMIPEAILMNARLATVLRRLFRGFKRFILLMWRLDMAWWFTLLPQVTGQILILHHIGRKTGLPRRTPVNYAHIHDAVYITAGFGSVSHWYRNIQAQPQIEIWLPDGRWQAAAEDITQRAEMLPIMGEATSEIDAIFVPDGERKLTHNCWRIRTTPALSLRQRGYVQGHGMSCPSVRHQSEMHPRFSPRFRNRARNE